MSLVHRGKTGRKVTVAPDTAMGVMQQDVASTKSSPQNSNASGDVSFGIPILAHVYVTGTDTTNATAYIFNANCPVKYRVVDAWWYNRVSPATDMTIQLLNGTDAITDDADNDAKTDDAPNRWGTLSDAFQDIAEDGTLKVVLSLSTGTGENKIDVYVLLLPVV